MKVYLLIATWSKQAGLRITPPLRSPEVRIIVVGMEVRLVCGIWFSQIISKAALGEIWPPSLYEYEQYY